ncbi:MAG TPA: aspartate aminotransferase family protein [Dehalococcoidales bacterium]|nr:aspartate aminotransferase family protein [Dehalococcoidales bacterium]
MTNWQEIESKYYIQISPRTPLTIVKGKGARVWDDAGKEYLDFVAGWAVDSLGHCHPAVVEAITKQANTLIQTSNQYYTIPQLQLAQLLVEHSCLNRLYVCNSGAEACEGSVKLARRYGGLKLNGAYEVITALNSFHGRTLAMTAATGQEKFQKPYIPLPPGFKNVPYNDFEAIKAATSEKTCAVMLEPVQGEGGVNIPADDYLKKVRRWCDEKGIVLILDEVQTGIGRLGTLFGYEQFGIEPDIMPLAKGLGSGVPVGAFLAKQKFCVFAPGEHGSTFGGNPLTSAAAYATVKYVIDNNISAKVKETGAYLMKGLTVLKLKYPFVTDVRGRGLLAAIEFSSEFGADALNSCLEQGLLVNRVKPNALRLMPPLIIGNREVDEALDILDKALSSLGKK